MIQVILPKSGTQIHPAARILEDQGFAVSTPDNNDDGNTIKIHIFNSLTNRRGTDASLTSWFSRAAALGQERGFLDKNLKFEFSFSGPDIEREYSKLSDESWDKDQDYRKKFHNTKAPDHAHLIFVSGWEPEDNNNPTDILNNKRTAPNREIIEFSERKNIPTILSCRAAHLALTDLAGAWEQNPIQLLSRKLKSIVNADVRNSSHPIVAGFNDVTCMPMSRLCALDQKIVNDLVANGDIDEIAYSEEAGTTITARGNMFHLSGHPECSRKDIEGEDRRDDERDKAAGKKKKDYLGETQNIERIGKAEHDGLLLCANIIKLADEHRKVVKNTASNLKNTQENDQQTHSYTLEPA
jgi:hypothetical protein